MAVKIAWEDMMDVVKKPTEKEALLSRYNNALNKVSEVDTQVAELLRQRDILLIELGRIHEEHKMLEKKEES